VSAEGFNAPVDQQVGTNDVIVRHVPQYTMHLFNHQHTSYDDVRAAYLSHHLPHQLVLWCGGRRAFEEQCIETVKLA
jgi:hypothetical protein